MVVTEGEEEDMVDGDEVLLLVTTAAIQGTYLKIALYHLTFIVVTVRLKATLWRISLISSASGRPKVRRPIMY